MWAWAFTYDYSVFMPEGKKPIRAALSHLVEIVNQVFGSHFVFLYLATLGLLMFIVLRVRARLGGDRALQDRGLFRDAIVIPPVIYLIFCVINFQGGPDLIPFFAFIGIFAAYFFLVAGRSLAGVRFRGSGSRPLVSSQVVPAAAALLVLATVVVVAASYRPEGRTFQEQYQDVEVIANLLKPEDKLYIHGPAEILVLLRRPNMNPYIALNSGADNFIASRTPGGFQAVIDQMEEEAPKIVAMGRLRNVRHRAELEEWVDEHYEKLALPHLESVYVRKQPVASSQ
jgi:NADH:ubiquinone oxidoreductase subunit 6 (subunit J)